MVRLVKQLVEGVQPGVVAPHQAEQVKPAQLDGEHQLQQRGKEERRQADAGQRDDGNRVVRLGILLGGSDDAQRDRNDQFEEHDDHAHDEAEPDRIVEFFDHWDRIVPAVSEIAGEEIPQPVQISDDDPLVHAVGRFQLGQPFLIGFAARLHGFLPGDILDIRGGQAAQHHVDDQHDKEENDDGVQQTLDDIFVHVKTSDLRQNAVGTVTADGIVRQRQKPRKTATAV